jgi:hypothetical protein
MDWGRQGGGRDAGPDHAKPPPTAPDGGVTEKGQTESKQGGNSGLKTTANENQRAQHSHRSRSPESAVTFTGIRIPFSWAWIGMEAGFHLQFKRLDNAHAVHIGCGLQSAVLAIAERLPIDLPLKAKPAAKKDRPEAVFAEATRLLIKAGARSPCRSHGSRHCWPTRRCR